MSVAINLPPTKSNAKDESKGGDDVISEGHCRASFLQMQLISTNIFEGGRFRRVTKKGREICEASQVISLSRFGIAAQRHVSTHALAQYVERQICHLSLSGRISAGSAGWWNQRFFKV
jgi:hypothetical protein